MENCLKTHKLMKNTADYIFENDFVPPQDEVLPNILKRNAEETLGVGEGWPQCYQPSLNNCPKCGEILLPIKRKEQKNENDKTLLLTMDHCKPVNIFSRKCNKCLIIFQAETLQTGLVNIGDTILVSLGNKFRLLAVAQYLGMFDCSVIGHICQNG